MLGHFVYNANITFPKSQTDLKQSRPIRLDTAHLLLIPGPLFVCRKSLWELKEQLCKVFELIAFHVLLLFKRNNFNNCLIKSKSEK